MYSEEHGTVTAEDGTEIEIKVQRVDISPELAKTIFDKGQEVGDWHWKHKTWRIYNWVELETVRAAARFYYGWNGKNEKVHKAGDHWIFEACYCC